MSAPEDPPSSPLNAGGVACSSPTVRAWLDDGTLTGRTLNRPSGRRFIAIDVESVEALIAKLTKTQEN